MPTNIITINCIHDVITNTVTNHITNCPSNLSPSDSTVFSNLSNLVVKVAEMPVKIWWQDFTFWGAIATMVSAIIMWRSVEEMRRQRELQQRQWVEGQLQLLTFKRTELNSRYIATGLISDNDTKQLGEKLIPVMHELTEVFMLLCSLVPDLNSKESKTRKQIYIDTPLIEFVEEIYKTFIKKVPLPNTPQIPNEIMDYYNKLKKDAPQ